MASSNPFVQELERQMQEHVERIKRDIAIDLWNLHSEAEWVLGAELVGYKGGDFLMTEDSKCWIAEYGQRHDENPILITLEVMEGMLE